MSISFVEKLKSVCEFPLCGNPKEGNTDQCAVKATQIHHCLTSHKDFLNIKTWKSGCLDCHNEVERVLSADVRKEKGLLI